MKSLVLILVCIFSGTCFAQYAKLISPLEPSLIFHNGQEGSGFAVLGRAGYYHSGSKAAYQLAQWGADEPYILLPLSGAASGWSVSNARARVQYYSNIDGHSNVYELAQANNSCDHVERDLFIESASPSYMGPDAAEGFTTSDWLNNLGSVRVSIGLNVVYSAMPPCQDSSHPNYTQFVISFILNNSTGQTLYYQVNLGDTKSPSLNGSVNWCPSYENDDGNSFCLDDDVRNIDGGVWVSPGVDVLNRFDFLPRISKIISSGHVKAGSGVSMDSNTANWKITSMYAGHITQGSYVASSRWYDFAVDTLPGGAFCSSDRLVQWTCSSVTPTGGGWGDVGGGCYHRLSMQSCR